MKVKTTYDYWERPNILFELMYGHTGLRVNYTSEDSEIDCRIATVHLALVLLEVPDKLLWDDRTDDVVNFMAWFDETFPTK